MYCNQVRIRTGIPELRAPQPKIQLSEDVMLTDEFRAKTNKWLLDMFGWEDHSTAVMDEIAFEPSKVMEYIFKVTGLLETRYYKDVTAVLMGPKEFYEITSHFMKEHLTFPGNDYISDRYGRREILGYKIHILPYMEGVLPIYKDVLDS